MKSPMDSAKKRTLFVKALAGRASVYRMVGDYARGEDDCRRVLAHAQQPVERAEALIDLASFTCRREHDYAKAKQLMKKAETAIDENHDVDTYARLLNQLGLIGIYEGTYNRSATIFLKMVSLCRKRGLKRRMLTAYSNMATLNHTKGELKDAKKYYQQCLTHARELNDLLRIGNTFRNLAILHRDMGDLTKALKYIEQCKAIYEKIGDKKGIGGASSVHGTIHYFKTEFDKALQCYRRHLDISQEVGDRMGISIGSNNVGIIFAIRAQLDDALKFYRQSLRIAEDIGYKKGMCINYGNIGKIHSDRGEYGLALKFFEKKLNLSKKVGLKRSIGESYIGIGRIDRENGRLDDALDAYQKAEEIFFELNDRINAAEAFAEKALGYIALGDEKKARDCAWKSLDLSRKVGAKRQEICALRILGIAQQGFDREKACSYLEQSISLARKEKVQLELARSLLSYVELLGRVQGRKGNGGMLGLLNEAEEILGRARILKFRERIKNLKGKY